MQRHQTILPLASLMLLAAACSNQKANPNAGVIHISGSAASTTDLPPRLQSASQSSSPSAADTAEIVCAQFTLQPYIPAADGTPQPSGSPIVFNSTANNANDAATYTDQIVGCIDGTPDTAGYNWGYIVTVTNFSQCGATPGTLGAAIPGVSPTTTTINVPVDCQAGLDVEVPIHVQVAVADPNPGGYVDITAGVNATDVQIGCKQADIPTTDNLLHFGESYISTDGGTQQGLVGLDTGTPNQFGGWVSGTPATDVDTYYTGDINPSAVTTIYQTFLSPCADGTSEYADTNHAQCVSNNTGMAAGTVAELADAFAELPGQGFAAVSVVGNGLTIYSSMGDTTGPNIMNAADSPFVPSYNVITTTNLGPYSGETITGVYIDQSTPLQFLVAATVGTTPEFATLSYNGTTWVLGSFAAPTAETISCNGLYAAPASCFAPTACVQPAECAQEQAAFGKGEYYNYSKNLCTRDGSALSYTLTESFCTTVGDNTAEASQIGNLYFEYVAAYATCYGTCAGAVQPAACAALGGPGCTVAYPGLSQITSAYQTACHAAIPANVLDSTDLFPAGYCTAADATLQTTLPAAYAAYVTAYAAACGTCSANTTTCANCTGLVEPSQCIVNGAVSCPAITACTNP